MNTVMKQRLVGTVVIGCLAIIFIPILLDGEGLTPPELTDSIPDAPPMPLVPQIEAQRPEIRSDTLENTQVTSRSNAEAETVDTATDANTNSIAETPPPAPAQPQLNNAGLPETWTVRLGSFGELANAEALVTRLRERDYRAFTRPLSTSRGPLTGVYVGPVLTQREAASLQQELVSAFELEGVVIQFSIDELEQ